MLASMQWGSQIINVGELQSWYRMGYDIGRQVPWVEVLDQQRKN